MSATVKVYLNTNERDSFFRGYVPGDPLRLAASWEERFQRNPGVFLEQVFDELNVDDPAKDWARDCRANRNRSLSKGDVVVFGETAWACESVGWRQIAMSDAVIVR